jgi:hypothetical protein
MRSIEDIAATGAAWVTEPELAMLCAFAKRAEQSEIEVERLKRELELVIAPKEEGGGYETLLRAEVERMVVESCAWRCTCDVGFTSRQLLDPSCWKCNVADEIRDSILEKLKARAALRGGE